MKRDFDTAAKTWDLNDARTRMSTAIADAMIGVLGLTGSEVLLDYGTGTGTVALRMQLLVRQVIAADSSRGMLNVLEERLKASGTTNVRAVVLDLEHDAAPPSDICPYVIVSTMTLHHIADTARFAAVLYGLLPVGGKLDLPISTRKAATFTSTTPASNISALIGPNSRGSFPVLGSKTSA